MKAIINGEHLDGNTVQMILDRYGDIIVGVISANEVPKRIVREGNRYLNTSNEQIGLHFQIKDQVDMEQAMELEASDTLEFVVFETTDWKIIPLENVIAKFHDAKTMVGSIAHSLEDLQLMESILELGVDIVLLEGEKETIVEMLNHISPLQGSSIPLVELEITEVKKIGTADRVCVDTCAVLQKGEGLLIGNTSKLFALIEAEVEETGYVASRPFRVNAGAIAAYVLNSEKTNYLSELKAGKKVMIVSKDGKTREELVCRVKIERRPMVLVKLKYEEDEAPIIVQDAETVRFITPNKAVSVKDLAVGNTVLGVHQRRGRHFGMEVDEYIEEH